MGLWALITASLILQEFATSALVLVVAVHSNVPLWPIHIIWVGTTLADMYVGYHLGTLVKKRLQKVSVIERIESWARGFVTALGDRGIGVALMLLGIVNFPYLNTFIAAWLDVPQNIAIFFTFIGNFLWYLLLWGTVLGLTSFIHNPSIILFIVVAIGVLSHVALKIFERAKKRSRKNSSA
jgi:membrane protein YqaA with SNARE-associated domain